MIGIGPGASTVVSREMDFAIVSNELVTAVKGMAACDATPFKTHATVRIALPRCDSDYMKWIPRQPKQLPKLSKDQQNNEPCQIRSIGQTVR